MVIVAGWAARDLVVADEPSPTAPAPVAAAATPTAARHGLEGQPSPAEGYPTAVTESPSPSPTESPGAVTHEHAPSAAQTPASSSVDDEARLQALLDSDARAYAAAILNGDVAAVRELTAGRCMAQDPAQVIVSRRAAIAAETGVPLDQITAGTPLTVHSDVGAGEAHAFLGLFAGGARSLTASPDGWLLEDGHWRNAEC